MRMVAPRTGAPEISVAENQPEYKTLTAALYRDQDERQMLLTRWRLTDAERELLLNGEDLYVALVTCGKPMQPLLVQVGPEGFNVGNGAILPPTPTED